jgi:hypothetical protein
MEDLMSRTYSPAKLSLAIWFSALAFGVQQLSAATVTYVVGTCKGGTHFSTIQSALDASPAPNTVEVCPGQYAEQVTITKPVTLEGITASNGDLAQIILPGTYAINAALEGGSAPVPAVAQVHVNNVSGGAVNLKNLEVNGMGFSMSSMSFVGIFYEESSGTINQVITSFQTGADTNATLVSGFGMFIQGGSSKPSVTVENSSIHDFNLGGIYAIGLTKVPDLKVTIENNNISTSQSNTFAIVSVEQGTDAAVSGNVVNGGLTGININAPAGSIADNTILGSGIRISLGADGPSVKSNKIFNTIDYGIGVGPSLKASVIEGNTIMTVIQPGSLDVTGTGIELNCNKVSSGHVNSNTLMDSLYGYGDAPAGFTGSNTYVGVVTQVTTCANDAPSKKASPAARLLLGQSRGQ